MVGYAGGLVDRYFKGLLSYVALGTVADVVQLDRNNRTLVRLGLELIRKNECAPGALALARIAGKNPNALTCADIGFGIGPRINAAGRLAHMGAGIECLVSLDFNEATVVAKTLHETNGERKDIQREMVDQAIIQAVQFVARDERLLLTSSAAAPSLSSTLIGTRAWSGSSPGASKKTGTGLPWS